MLDKRLKARLLVVLVDAGFTYAEVGKLFGVTRQRIEQIVRPLDFEKPKRGPKYIRKMDLIPKKWTSELLSAGLTLIEIAELFGVDPRRLDVPRSDGNKRRRPSGDHKTAHDEFRISAVGRTYRQIRRNVFMSAYLDGASHFELAHLFGIAEGTVGVLLHRYRRTTFIETRTIDKRKK